MARSITLIQGARVIAVVLALSGSSLLADPAKPAPPATNAPPVSPVKPGTPAKPATPPPPPAPAAPIPLPADFNRYGKIWSPSDDVAHPLKLNLNFPGVGDVKVPSQDELNMRDKLEQLATLSDDDIRKKLNEWPPFSKMKLSDEGQLLIRIQQFKDLRAQIASKRAHELGLTLTPDQQCQFEKQYWDKRLQMDRELAKQFEPILKARDQKMREELFRAFSTSGTQVPPPPATAPKPPTPPAPAPPLAQTKPASPPPAVGAKPPVTNASPIPAIGAGTPPSAPPMQ